MGKGFGYVNFSTVDSVTLALELNGTKVGQREIRVKVCSADNPSKRKRMASGNEGPNKKFKKFNNDKPSQNKVIDFVDSNKKIVSCMNEVKI